MFIPLSLVPRKLYKRSLASWYIIDILLVAFRLQNFLGTALDLAMQCFCQMTSSKREKWVSFWDENLFIYSRCWTFHLFSFALEAERWELLRFSNTRVDNINCSCENWSSHCRWFRFGSSILTRHDHWMLSENISIWEVSSATTNGLNFKLQ